MGITTSAAFADVNGDGTEDPIVAGEWMPVVVFINQKGTFTKQAIAGSTGLWQNIQVADVNGDGKMDLLGGNWGLNSKLASGKTDQ